jgi:hypothetical protein
MIERKVNAFRRDISLVICICNKMLTKLRNSLKDCAEGGVSRFTNHSRRMLNLDKGHTYLTKQ